MSSKQRESLSPVSQHSLVSLLSSLSELCFSGPHRNSSVGGTRMRCIAGWYYAAEIFEECFLKRAFVCVR